MLLVDDWSKVIWERTWSKSVLDKLHITPRTHAAISSMDPPDMIKAAGIKKYWQWKLQFSDGRVLYGVSHTREDCELQLRAVAALEGLENIEIIFNKPTVTD